MVESIFRASLNARPLPPRPTLCILILGRHLPSKPPLRAPRALPSRVRPHPPPRRVRPLPRPLVVPSLPAKDTRPSAVLPPRHRTRTPRFAAAAVADGRNTMGFRARLSPSARLRRVGRGRRDAATFAEGGLLARRFLLGPSRLRAGSVPTQTPPMIGGSSRVSTCTSGCFTWSGTHEFPRERRALCASSLVAARARTRRAGGAG